MSARSARRGTSFKKIALFSVPSRYDKKKYPLYKCLGCKLVRPRPLPYNEQTKYDIYDEEGLTKCYNPAVKKIDFDSREYKDYFKNFKTYARYIKKLGIKGASPGHRLRQRAPDEDFGVPRLIP